MLVVVFRDVFVFMYVVMVLMSLNWKLYIFLYVVIIFWVRIFVFEYMLEDCIYVIVVCVKVVDWLVIIL